MTSIYGRDAHIDVTNHDLCTLDIFFTLCLCFMFCASIFVRYRSCEPLITTMGKPALACARKTAPLVGVVLVHEIPCLI